MSKSILEVDVYSDSPLMRRIAKKLFVIAFVLFPIMIIALLCYGVDLISKSPLFDGIFIAAVVTVGIARQMDKFAGVYEEHITRFRGTVLLKITERAVILPDTEIPLQRILKAAIRGKRITIKTDHETYCFCIKSRRGVKNMEYHISELRKHMPVDYKG